MKAAELSNCLELSAGVLRAANAPALAGSILQVASVFRLAPTKKVSDVVAKLESIEVASGSFLQTKIESVAALMPALSKLATSLAPRSQTDFELVSSLLGKFSKVSVEDWVASACRTLSSTPAAKAKKAKAPPEPLNNDLVDRYHRMLETALGDDAGFKSAFANLDADPEMKAPEVAALAKRFASASVKARSAALRKIFARHQALMISRAASAATAGRIAG